MMLSVGTEIGGNVMTLNLNPKMANWSVQRAGERDCKPRRGCHAKLPAHYTVADFPNLFPIESTLIVAIRFPPSNSHNM